MRKLTTVLQNLRVGVTSLVALLIVASSTHAQVGTATLSGTVTDPSAAVIPQAQVILSNTARHYVRQTTTGAGGNYVITSIDPGTYVLEVKAPAFKTERRTDVILTPAQSSTLDVQLEVGATSENVTVNEAPSLLQTSDATLGSVVGSTEVQDLPLNARNFSQVVLTLPGVVPIQTGTTRNDSFLSTGIDPSVYGQRPRNNNWTIDGVSNNDLAGNGVNTFPPPEAITEVKVLSGMTSGAYGVGSGANVSVVTRSGTDNYHGDGWEAMRNSALNARGQFVPKLGTFIWNQFGGAFGGPVIIPHVISKEKAWYFFGYYEGIRVVQAANVTGLVPTAAELNGDFSADAPIYNPYTTVTDPITGTSTRTQFANNIIPTGPTSLCAPQPTCINASTLTLAKGYYPAPNLPAGIIPGVNYLNSQSNHDLQNAYSIRGDHQFSEKDSIFGRYTYTHQDTISQSTNPTLPTNQFYNLTNAMVSETHLFSPTFAVTSRFSDTVWHLGGGPTFVAGLAAQAGTLTAWPSFVADNTGVNYSINPPVTIAGLASIPGAVILPQTERELDWMSDANKTTGRHTIGFGGYFQHWHTESIDTPRRGSSFDSLPSGNFGTNTGYGLASFLLGLPSSVLRTVGDSSAIYNAPAMGFYVQDDFRATPKLTINLGLRWDWVPAQVNQLGSGGLNYTTGLYYWNKKNPVTGAPANVTPGAIAPDYHDFEPRFGIAYQVTPKTVVRAGWGIFDNLFGFERSQAQQGNSGSWPFAAPENFSALNTGLPDAIFPNPFPGPPVFPSTPQGFNQNLEINTPDTRTGYVYEYSFTVQRAFTPSLTFEAAYFGSRGHRLCGDFYDNVATTPGPGPIQPREKFPTFGVYVVNGENVFQSYYDALSLKLEKRFSRGLTFNINYVWSKNIDYMDDAINNWGTGVTWPTRYDVPRFRGDAGYDIPQRLAMSYVYQIPGKTNNRVADAVVAHWRVSGVTQYNSGQAFGPALGFDNLNIGLPSGNEFPDLIGNPRLSNPTPQQWFNTNAFAVPVAYTNGDAGRNILRTDGLVNWDFSLAKEWPFRKESDRVEFRGDFFNTFNNTVYGLPGLTLGTAQFGTVSSTLTSPRQIQFQLKVHF